MTNSIFLKSALLRGCSALPALVLVGAGLMSASPALAQAASTAAGTPSDQATQNTNSTSNAAEAVPEEKSVAGQPAAAGPADSGEAIVVTGSRIGRPNLESTVPITSVTGAELEQTGRVSIGDVLNDLPQLQSSFSQANSTRFLGTAGLNLIDLYDLGPQRTLVLVNGRRHVGADILNNAVSVDVNTIPADLIDRVDIVTGGNSAIYGSDAIAGVVNFVLKDHFEGLQLHGQGGISEHGDAGSYYSSVLAGKNFAGGRGNIAVDLEYARQNSLYASERKDLRQANGFVTVDSDPSGSVNGSDGNPDNIFFRNIRSATINSGGLISFASPSGACGRDTQAQASGIGAGRGRPFTCNYIFNPDGTLVPETGTRVGLSSGSDAAATSNPAGSSFIGGNGNTRREGQLVQILPQLDRYSANLIGHFEVSDAFVPFIEAKYVRTNSVGQGNSGPAFYNGATLDGFYERPALNNPFLTAQARATITNALIAGGTPAASITDDTRVTLRRNLTDLGVRTEEAKRETYRIVGGVRGTFNDDWKYELSGNYGVFKERTKVLGNLNTQRMLLGLDAVRNAAGQIVCGSQIDPSRAYDDVAGNPAVLAADIAACVPVNPFGEGSISQAAKDYVLTDTTSVGKITQLDFAGFVSGNTGKFFNLPGGPVGFAVGGEYRRETNDFRADPLVQAGYTFYNALTPFNPPAFEVKEAYAELRLPILKDLPFAQELTVSGAGRVADYKGSTGTVYTYNVGVDYAPIRDLRFRGNYARAVRAPNLSELYSAQGQNFAPAPNDPCAARNLATGSATRAANCTAAGVPAGYDYVYNSSLEIVSGGNPDLTEEKSDSYTYGGVFQPSFLPGFSLSVDYYNIKVKDVITSVSAQQILNSCYDAADLDNQFCSLIQRVPAGQTGPNGEQPGRVLEGSLLVTPLNFAKLQVRGINTELAYSRRVSDTLTLGTKLNYNHALQNDNYLDPTDPNRADRYLTELGRPKDQFNWDVDLKVGQLFVNYQLRYLSKQLLSAYEDTNSLQGRPAQNTDYSDIIYYPSVVYHDIRLGLNVTETSSFYFGVDNFANKRPPLGSTGIGEGSAIFEPVGRRFYAGVNARF